MASRYLIGIDLGTTNSVVAYIDTQNDVDGDSPVHVFRVPQLLAHGEISTFPALPSFLYFPTPDELSSGAVCATWDEDPPILTGVHAREQRSACNPNRQVSSAKSWLTNSDIDRRARILPVQAEPPQPMISPVEASARYLRHLRDAWNGAMGKDVDARFEHQEIVHNGADFVSRGCAGADRRSRTHRRTRRTHSPRRTIGSVLCMDCVE